MYYKYFRVENRRLLSSYISTKDLLVESYRDTNTGKLVKAQELKYSCNMITKAPEGSPGIFVTREPVINWGNCYGNNIWVALYQVEVIGDLSKCFRYDTFRAIVPVKLITKQYLIK